MNYQNAAMPTGAEFSAATPLFNGQTVPEPILNKHLAPRGKTGLLVVESGALQFVWLDTGETLDAAPGHPVVIWPERFHRVKLTGPVTFHIEFYQTGDVAESGADQKAARPGEKFINSK
ncbi:MAG: DUF1971 domain-containing protein [Victivallaceae bacterium]|nr:DUF1971 domain-containing protein [Victivallaceae bacterium]